MSPLAKDRQGERLTQGQGAGEEQDKDSHQALVNITFLVLILSGVCFLFPSLSSKTLDSMEDNQKSQEVHPGGWGAVG